MRIQTFFCIILLSILLSACAGNARNSETGGNEAAEINMRLGLNYMQRGDYEFALEKLEKALQQDPNLPSAHNTIDILYQRLGEEEKAEKRHIQSDASNFFESSDDDSVEILPRNQSKFFK